MQNESSQKNSVSIPRVKAHFVDAQVHNHMHVNNNESSRQFGTQKMLGTSKTVGALCEPAQAYAQDVLPVVVKMKTQTAVSSVRPEKMQYSCHNTNYHQKWLHVHNMNYTQKILQICKTECILKQARLTRVCKSRIVSVTSMRRCRRLSSTVFAIFRHNFHHDHTVRLTRFPPPSAVQSGSCSAASTGQPAQ